MGAAIGLLSQTQLVTAIATLVAGAALLAIFHQPVIGLALCMLAGPFQPLERVALQLPIDSGQVFLGITLLSYLARSLVARRSPLSTLTAPPTLALIVFITVCILSFFPARDFGDWANECIKWLQLLVIALLVMNEHDPRKRAVIIGAILLSAMGQALYGIVQADVRGFGPREFQVIGSKNNFRAYGTFEQPNPFGGYMGLVWPLAAGVFLFAISDFRFWILARLWRQPMQSKIQNPKSKITTTIFSGLIAALCLIALEASGSRGALIGAAAAAVVMGLALLRHPLRWVGAVVLMGLLAIGLDVINVPLSLDGQLQQILDLDVRNAHILPTTFSTIERLAHWQAAVRMIEASPWLGVGFGNYAAAYPEFRLYIWDNALGHAHNYYLNIFAETGAIGFIAYLALWATVFVVAIKLVRQTSSSQPSSRFSVLHSPFSISVGLLGAFAHLTAHHFFDNLYVANMHMLIGVYIGLLAVSANDPAQAAPLRLVGLLHSALNKRIEPEVSSSGSLSK
jgi:O-antigen ligase